MSEVAEMYQGMRDFKKLLRATYGKPCPECQRLLPRANPTILLPQQRCRIHKWRDPRPELTQSEYDVLTGREANND